MGERFGAVRHRLAGLLCFLLLLAGRAGFAQENIPTPADKPQLEVVFFGTVRGYVIGLDPVVLTGTIRNVGKAELPADTVAARVVAVSGLDYSETAIAPKLPRLEPGTSTTVQWRLLPIRANAPLVAALSLEATAQNGAAVSLPSVSVAPLYHLDEPPADKNAFQKEPRAGERQNDAFLENENLRAQVIYTTGAIPLLRLSVRIGSGWRTVGTTLPLAEVLSAEGGQQPWWEVFKGEEFRAVNKKGEASLYLSGGIGLRWRAILILTLRSGSSVLDIQMQCAPLRPMRISGVHLAPLLAGDVVLGVPTETLRAESVGPNSLTAARWNEITVGTLWSNAPLFPDWKTTALATSPGAEYQRFGAEWRTQAVPVALSAETLLTLRCRLFVLTPSASVGDARKVTLPAAVRE